jgi:hypothetical protein
MMKRLFGVCVATVWLAASLYADVTLKQVVTGKGLGMSGTMPTTVYIKGNKMRTDTEVGDRVQTQIFDVDAQKMYVFDSKKKEADVYDMAAFAAEMGKSVDTSNMKASFKATGKTKPIDGSAATGYDLEITVPATMGGSKDMAMTMTLTGPVWIVKGAPGTADYAHFFKSAVEKGWIFSDPRAAKGQPGQAKAMAEMYRQLAAAGGIPYETEAQLKMSGSGAMAGLFAKIGNVTFTTTTTSVAAGSLAADLFAPPAGYKLNNKK